MGNIVDQAIGLFSGLAPKLGIKNSNEIIIMANNLKGQASGKSTAEIKRLIQNELAKNGKSVDDLYNMLNSPKGLMLSGAAKNMFGFDIHAMLKQLKNESKPKVAKKRSTNSGLNTIKSGGRYFGSKYY